MVDLRLFAALLLATVAISYLPGSHAKKYIVEVLVVMDKPSYIKWNVQAKRAGNTVEEEVKSFMYEVNILYKGLKAHGLDIEIRLVDDKILYLDSHIIGLKLLKWEGGIRYVEHELALDRFKFWTDVQRTDSGLDFDVAMFITAYPFLERAVLGIAEKNTVCRHGIGVVEPQHNMTIVTTLAHEIGHVLGLHHDGEWDDCDGEAGYIMRAAGSILSDNARIWSTCSIKALKKKISNRLCLTTEKTDAKPIVSPRIGQLIGADETCRRSHGTHLSRYSYINSGYANTCKNFFCDVHLKITTKSKKFLFIKTGSTTNYHSEVTYGVTPEGLQCGSNMSCQDGRCVPDTSASGPWNSRCPYGDTPTLEGDYQSCSQAKCDNDIFKKICCSSCD